MENQDTLSLQSKLIIELTVSDRDTPTLVCRGRITRETASQFRSEIKTLVPNHKFLKADLGGIDFVDSDGLGSILGTYILALSHGCDLMLVNVNSRVKDLLNITHLEAVFEKGRRTGLTKRSSTSW
jgi:anti-anti-sigma factor